jgi:hypothetical protein
MKALLLAALLVSAPASAGNPPPAKPVATAQAAAPPPADEGQAIPGRPVSMQGRENVDASVPAKFKAKIAAAQLQGAMLQQEDAAVWVASNAIARADLKPLGTATGWLAKPAEAQARLWKVSFTSKQGERQAAYVDVDVDLTAPPVKFRIEKHESGRDLGAEELALAKARDAVDADMKWQRCADIYNYSAVYVDSEKGREIQVRAVPARHDQKMYLLGGFHQFTFPLKGGKARHFQQTTTCLELPLTKKGIGFMVTSLNSTTPTLFHVFASLSYERPIYVKTSGRTWKVDGGLVTVVDKDSLKSVKVVQDPDAQ